jgi:transcriptional regulator with XRE-family HTH domain
MVVRDSEPENRLEKKIQNTQTEKELMSTHSEAVMRYQKRYPQKFSAQQKAQRYPHLLIVLYECLHTKGTKENHHPDYAKWRQVFRVCHDCHKTFHPAKIRDNNPEYIEMLRSQRVAGRILATQEMAKRIRYIRSRMVITQSDLGAAIGVSQTVVSSWEKGICSPRGKYILRAEAFFSLQVFENGVNFNYDLDEKNRGEKMKNAKRPAKESTKLTRRELLALRDGVSFLKNHHGIIHGDLAKKCQVGDSMITNLLKGTSHSERCLKIIMQEVNEKRKQINKT